MDIWDPAFIPYRLRIVRGGVVATLLVLATFLLFRALPDGDQIPGHVFWTIWLVTLSGCAVMWLLPWDRLLRTSAGKRVLYLWSIADILLITVLIAWAPASPSLFLLYVLTSTFFALTYALRGQFGLFMLTTSCYLGLFVTDQMLVSVADVALRLGLLASVAVLASFGSRELMRGMTASIEARNEFEREKKQYETLVNAQSDLGQGVSITQLSTRRLTYVNDAMCRIYGYTRDELIGKDFMDLIAPSEQELVGELTRARRRGERSAIYDRDFTVVRKDGERRTVEVVSKPLGEDSVVSVVRDVTEQRTSERELRNREELLRAISELSTDFVYSTRVEPGGGQLWEWASDGFRSVTGYETTDPEMHNGWLGLIHPSHMAEARAIFGELLSKQVPVRTEIVIATKNGEERCLEVTAEAVVDPGRGRVTRIFGAAQDVTDKKKAEQALRESEARYRALFDRLPVGMFVRRLDGTGLDANPACVEMYRYPDQATFIRTPARELYVDAEERKRFVALLEAEEEALFEAEFRRYDGTTFWGRMHGRAVRDDDGEVAFFEGAVIDVTERRRAEQAMQHSVSLLRSTLESTWDGILVVQNDGRVVTYNQRFAEMWGLKQELLDEGNDDLLLASILRHLKDPEGFLDRVRDLYSQPDRESFDVIDLADGRVFERLSKPQRMNDEVVGRVWSFRDVTERKESARQLEESLGLLRTTLASIAEGILVIDEAGEIVIFNERFAEVWGIPLKALEGGDRARFLELGAQKVVDPDAFLTSIMRGESDRVSDEALLIELRDGRVLERFARAAREEGIGRVISFRDVTQRRALEEQLRQAQKMEAVGRLAGGVAHDFNNLLTAILGYCELLKMTPGLSEEIRRDVDEIDVAAQMGADITAQLLDLSRRRVLRPEVLDVNEIVAAMEPMLGRLIGDDIVLDTDKATDECRVEADRSQIEQILLNLVVNARDALPSGGEVRISTRLVDLSAEDASKGLRLQPGSHVLLTVADDGSGIDPQVRDRIFEPFFTTHKGGNTGLGLSTVYGIVSQYNGHIAVDTHPGLGSTFRVYLPAAPDGAIPLARARAAERWLSGTESVLLVEDDDAIRRLARRALERYGYSVFGASDANEALELARGTARSVDLLVTDVVMPGMGGRDLARKLLAERPGLKILYVSGYTGDALARFGDLEWNEEFLAKPFRPDVLAAKVREVLNRKAPSSATS